jgi:catechol 2,3-dioxygenase-like lactoylglutathione lyase family enzyme
MHLLRIGHVNLSIDDVTAAEAFYAGVLGLERSLRPDDTARAGAWFRLGAVELHLSIEVGAENARSRRHVAFEVAELGRLRAHLEAHGLIVEEGRPAPGLRRFFVRDPAGNRLEFYAMD